ncbi:MAG: hypothetical protein HC936_17445 [Leptolyngbyaceae cyanobacterium SU_3_3]|nr:hypothetical protein [Leptolyngbyaceae cyanobacterium SU_3_3]
MPRLSEKAFSILQTEIQNISSTDSAIQIQRELAIKRLQRLQSQEGPPLSYEEMRETLADLFPDFPEKVLRAAAKANKAPRSAAPKAPPKATVAIPWGAIKASSIALLILAGGIYAVNLPIPWLRLAVASKAPILLIPSFMSMDHHYRGAVNTVEQADQLINRATAPADFELGNTKVKAAQKHLDALPVWFVGYYPSEYCGFFGCSWRFTLDEFRAAREKVARMEARLFQEGNARTQLEEKIRPSKKHGKFTTRQRYLWTQQSDRPMASGDRWVRANSSTNSSGSYGPRKAHCLRARLSECGRLCRRQHPHGQPDGSRESVCPAS